jgi:phosphatidylinositol dimannoside acyltransferase
MSTTSTVTATPTRGVATRTRLMHVVRVFVGRLPPQVGNPLADRFGDVVYHFARKSRRNAISNMRHVLGPNVSKKELKKTVRGIFHNVMRNYYDLCRAPDMTDAEIDRIVEFDWDAWKNVVDLQERKVGVILVTAHFGSFDMMTQVINRRGLPLTVLISRIKPAWLSDFVNQLRGNRGLDLIEVGEEEESKLNLGALKKCVTILRSGGMLGVVADRNIEPNGVQIKFFGHDTMVAAGVAKMAIRARAVVIPSLCYRLPGNRYSLVFTEPIEPPNTGSSQDDVKALLTTIFSRFEHHIAKNPEQWTLLQPVWKPIRPGDAS